MRPAAIAALVVAVLVAVGALGPARAQIVGDPGATTTTAPTTATTAPPPPPGDEPAEPGPGPVDPPSGEGGGDGVVPPGTPQVVPPGFQAQINSVKRSRANNTTKLLIALQPLMDAGLSEEE